jgi:hypothetical protein
MSDEKRNPFGYTPAEVNGVLQETDPKPLASHAQRVYLRDLLDGKDRVKRQGFLAAPEAVRLFRSPIGLIAKDVAPGGTGTFSTQPYVAHRPQYLIVDPGTARHFNLVKIQIHNTHYPTSEGDVPLEPFSIEYMANDEFSAVNKLTGWPTIETWSKLTVFVRARSDEQRTLARTFRGILWCEVLHP